MKNRKFFKYSILGLLPVALALGVISGVFGNAVKETSGYSYESNPTTINLNDNTADEIRAYYSSLSSKSANELKGNNLLINLKKIISNGQKYFRYDNGSLWAMYEITDRDWEASPASEIVYGNYNPTTNIITNYQYGTSASNSKNNPFIHALYVDRNVPNQTTAWDDHNQDQWGINQEHIWPKSQGFNSTGSGGARGDPMHLWAGNGRVNGTEHNNNMYGFVDLSKTTRNPYTDLGYANLKDNYSGKSLTIPTSNDTVFEPQDSDKGDIARAIFYMVARYNNLAGDDSGINQDNPNLALKQTTQSLSSYTTTTQNGLTGYMGVMTDLLYWNHMDPVDEYEIHRNNLLYRNFTNNRNPFIDYPEWADYIWGTATYSGREYVSYSSTPTGSVDLSTDVINGFKGEEEITLESIKIVTNPDKVDYFQGEEFDRTGMVVKGVYSNGAEKTITNYTVSPSGEFSITDDKVTISYGGKTATIGVTVYPCEIQDKTVEISGNNFKGGTSGGGESVTIEKEPVTLSCSSAYGDEAAQQLRMYKGSTLTISSTKKIKSITFTVVKDYSVDNIVLSDNSDSKVWEYTLNAQVRISGVTIVYEEFVPPIVHPTSVTLTPSTLSLEIGDTAQLNALVEPTNSADKSLTWSSNNDNVSVSSTGLVNALASGTSVVTVKTNDGNKTATCNVTVNKSFVLNSLSISGSYKTTFNVGDTFNYDGIEVIAHYSRDGETKDEDVTEFISVSTPDLSTQGTKTVTVSFGGKTGTYQITVAAPEICTTVYEKITSLDDIEVNTKYVIGYESNGVLKALPNAFSEQHPSGIDLTITNNIVEDTENVASFTIGAGSATNTYTISNGTKFIKINTSSNVEYQNTSYDLGLSVSDGKFLFTNGSTRKLCYRTSTYNFFGSYLASINNTEYFALSLFKEKLDCSGYSPIFDLNDLKGGDKVIFVGTHQNDISSQTEYYAMTNTISNNIAPGELITNATSSLIKPTEDTQIFEIVISNGKFVFKTSDGKYLSASNSSNNYIKYSTSIDVNSSFQVEKKQNGAEYKIFAPDSSCRSVIQFNYNNNKPRFTCYSGENVSPILIYKDTAQIEADTWAKSFLTDTIHCHLDNWSAWSTSYNALSTSAKELLEDATYIDRFDTDMSWRAQAAARYDFLLEEFGLTPFINGRGETSSRPSIISKINEIPTTTLIVIIVGAVGVSAIGGYFFYKKRKEGRI